MAPADEPPAEPVSEPEPSPTPEPDTALCDDSDICTTDACNGQGTCVGTARCTGTTATGFGWPRELPAAAVQGPGASTPIRVVAKLRNGEAALSDPGACRDLAGSLTEGLRGHLADVKRRVPGAHLVLQLDEPSLTAVLRGQIKTASQYRTHRAVDRQLVESALRDVLAVHDGPALVHSCAPDVPFALLRRAGADAVSFDFELLTERDDEVIGEAVEAGTKLFAGVVPGTDGPLSDPAGSVMGVRKLWRRLGLNPGSLAESVTVTPSCGLAGASPAYARAALAHCTRAARSLADNPE